MAELCSLVWVDPIFIICSCIDGHVSCFCLLAVVNNAAMNTGGKILRS